MKNSVIKTLLGVELYEFEEKFIYELRQKQKKQDRIFEHLPTYTINTNEGANGRPVEAYWYLQFVGIFNDNNNNSKYLFFDLSSLDGLLNEEINQDGIENLFKEFDFKKILSVFTPATEDDYIKFGFLTTHYLIVELTYETSYDHEGGYDCEMYVDITGYLDNNMEIKKFEEKIRFSE